MTARQRMLLGFFISTLMLGMVPAGPAEGIEAITKPSRDVKLGFVNAGRIAEVLVKEGDLVQAGQVLMRMDDQAERISLERLKAQAEDMIQIHHAQAQLEQKRVTLEKIQSAYHSGAATDLELREAKLAVTVAELSLELAQFERLQAQRQYEAGKVSLERMVLKSSIDGKVEQIQIQPGESVDAYVPVIRVVSIDPLWVDAPVPLATAGALKLGQVGRICHQGSDGQGIEGRIIHIAAVADAASETLTVRLEVPNPTGRPAGEYVQVSFPSVSAEGESE